MERGDEAETEIKWEGEESPGVPTTYTVWNQGNYLQVWGMEWKSQRKRTISRDREIDR